MKISKIVTVLIVLGIIVVLPIFNLYSGFWHIFSRAYVILALSFVWLIVLLRFFSDMKKRKWDINPNLKYSVIVPIYNESEKELNDTINSIMANDGTKDVILADDGSCKDTKAYIMKLCEKYPQIKLISNINNKGKKFVQAQAIKIAKYEYIISCDSDTIFPKDTLLKLISPLQNPKIGLSNCNVEITNNKTNLITKMQVLQYYGAIMIGRKSLGAFGMMNCASGVGIAFRKSDFIRFEKEYLGLRPLGLDCKFGEDRFMTNIMLKNRLKVVMVEDAKAYTYVPETLDKYIRQQLRWRISGVIEGIHILLFSWKKPILFLHSILNLLLPFLCISVIITILASNIIIGNWPNILFFVGIIIMATFVRDSIILVERRDLIKYIIPFSLLNLSIILWLWVIAPFRIGEQSWITR